MKQLDKPQVKKIAKAEAWGWDEGEEDGYDSPAEYTAERTEAKEEGTSLFEFAKKKHN